MIALNEEEEEENTSLVLAMVQNNEVRVKP